MFINASHVGINSNVIKRHTPHYLGKLCLPFSDQGVCQRNGKRQTYLLLWNLLAMIVPKIEQIYVIIELLEDE